MGRDANRFVGACVAHVEGTAFRQPTQRRHAGCWPKVAARQLHRCRIAYAATSGRPLARRAWPPTRVRTATA